MAIRVNTYCKCFTKARRHQVSDCLVRLRFACVCLWELVELQAEVLKANRPQAYAGSESIWVQALPGDLHMCVRVCGLR